MTATFDLSRLTADFRAFRDKRAPASDLTIYGTGAYSEADLDALIGDLDRMIEGWRPTADDLAAAAQVDEWYVHNSEGAEYLKGWISRHPWDPGRRQHSNTSSIVVADKDLRWVRTVGRLYELGAPKNDKEAHILRGIRSI